MCKNTAYPESQQNIRRLVATVEEPASVEVTSAVTTKHEDLRTNHQEADNRLAHQMIVVASEGNKGVSVISDDTDVIVLLHHYIEQKVNGVVIMESPVQEGATIDIRATAEDIKHIISDLLAAHALSGCNISACYFGIGKGTVVKVIRAHNT